MGEEAEGIYLLPNGIRAETADGKVATLGYDFSLQYVSPDADKDRLTADGKVPSLPQKMIPAKSKKMRWKSS